MNAYSAALRALPQPNHLDWFVSGDRDTALEPLGFRYAPGGVHLSKTMMLAELHAVMDGAAAPHPAEVERAVITDNILAKPTGKARRLALAHLTTLYGITRALPVQAVALRLWQRSPSGRPLLALLCALAREPLLRDTAAVILAAPVGTPIRWPDLAAAVEARHPGRYSPKMLKSLAQNCASTWTQSAHLRGKVAKHRSLAQPSPEATAYAALLGELAGFGGPALLRSPWMAVLDRPESDLMSLLRRAESIGLVRVRAGGGVVQISARCPMAEVLGVPELADGR
jgi:hypothetical protein